MSEQFEPVPKPDDYVGTPPDADAPVVVNNNFHEGELLDALPVVVKETKEGYKTTEFWIAVVGILATQFDVTSLPPKFQGIVAGAIGIAYILSRGIAKKGIPAVEVKEA